jgi:hypothetical protein
MVSKLVDHISYQVKKLIVEHSGSRKEAAPKDASVTSATIPVCKILFGTPIQMESDAWVATAAVCKGAVERGSKEQSASCVMEGLPMKKIWLLHQQPWSL